MSSDLTLPACTVNRGSMLVRPCGWGRAAPQLYIVEHVTGAKREVVPAVPADEGAEG